jgi:hypothetical protein
VILHEYLIDVAISKRAPLLAMDTLLWKRTACTVVQIGLAIGKVQDSCNGIKLLVSLRGT